MTYKEVIELMNRRTMLNYGEYIKVKDAILEALEKQVPTKPSYEGGCDRDGNIILDMWICPSCDKEYELEYEEYKYCPNCGQAIDWSVNNE